MLGVAVYSLLSLGQVSWSFHGDGTVSHPVYGTCLCQWDCDTLPGVNIPEVSNLMVQLAEMVQTFGELTGCRNKEGNK